MFKQCEKYFRAHCHVLVVLVLLSILGTAVSIVSPYITGNIITDISSGHSLFPILHKCKVLLLLFLLSHAMGVFSSVLKLKIELSMGKEFNCDVIFHIQDLPYSYIQSQNLSALNQAVNQDTNTIIAFCIDLVLTVTTKILNVLCILFLCFSLNIEMSLIIVISSILYTLLYLVLKKKLYATRKNLRICESNFFAKLFEQLEFIYFIKTNSIESSFRKRVDDSFAKFTSAKVNDSYLQYLISVLQSSISLLSQLILLIVGAQCVYNDKITIGLLITFSTYFSQVQNGILYFLNLGSSYQNARVSSQRIHDILSKSKEPSGHKKFSPPLSVSCKNLSFTFSDENRFLYENVSFSLQPGKIYGFSGKNGAGKKTFINILLGLYNDIIPRDMISFNGIDIHDIDIHWLREKISYVSQESTIVPATYQDNLLFLPEGNFPSKINADRIIHLLNAKTLNPSDFIASSSLSGGEARKICLLRSFLKDSDFLILDEPDASLDQESCLQLVKHLQQLKSKKTILLVSHNPIFVNCCDEIICL